MTDLNKEIENFLQVPKFKERIERSKLKYDEIENHFSSPEWDSQTCCDEDYINSAWSGWQEKAKAQTVPDTHIVVPKEPTKEMLKAGIHSYLHQDSIKEKDGSTSINFKYIYQEMIGASESGAEG